MAAVTCVHFAIVSHIGFGRAPPQAVPSGRSSMEPDRSCTIRRSGGTFCRPNVFVPQVGPVPGSLTVPPSASELPPPPLPPPPLLLPPPLPPASLLLPTPPLPPLPSFLIPLVLQPMARVAVSHNT